MRGTFVDDLIFDAESEQFAIVVDKRIAEF